MIKMLFNYFMQKWKKQRKHYDDQILKMIQLSVGAVCKLAGQELQMVLFFFFPNLWMYHNKHLMMKKNTHFFLKVRLKLSFMEPWDVRISSLRFKHAAEEWEREQDV